MTGKDIQGDMLLHHRVSQFIFHEARLLDEQKWDDWDALFTEDGVYWAPASPDQPDPLNHVSLIHEDSLLRKVRIARFSNPTAFSLQPFPRTVHIVSNITIDKRDGAEAIVSSCFQMTEYRRNNSTQFNGRYIHELIEIDGQFMINLKKAILVNCDGAQQSSSIYF